MSPLIILAATAAALIIDFSSPRQLWMGEYLLTEEWLATAFFLCSGVCAAAAAFDAARRWRPPGLTLFWYSGRRRLPMLFLVCAWLIAVIVPVGVTAVCAGSTLPTSSNPQLAPAIAQLMLSIASLELVILLGFCCGLIGGRLGVVISILMGYSLGFMSMGSHATPLTFGGANGSLLGLTVPRSHLLDQLLVITVSFTVCAAGLAWSSSRTLAPARVATCLVVASLVVMSLLAAGRGRFAPSNSQDPKDCSTGPAYSACTTPEHARLLRDALIHQNALVTVGALLQIDFPTSSKEYVNGEPLSPGVVYWSPSSDALASGRLSVSEFVNAVSFPMTCPAMLSTNGPSDAFTENAFNFAQELQPLIEAIEARDSPDATPQLRRRMQTQWRVIASCRGAK